MSIELHPILKWAGGKTQLLERVSSNMPASYNNYHEPFIGGASVLLGLTPQNSFINDINPQLINLYIKVKTMPEDLIEIINKLDSIPCTKELYYDIRTRYNDKIANRILDTECAAYMVWINKHCFNGLYRVNNRGLFNVPYNNKVGGKSINEDNIRAISEYFNNINITITCSDFERACEKVQPGDFVYFDSPYVPISESASFTDYTMYGFSLRDHQRLAVLFRRLDGMGVKVMLSNNDVPLVRRMYKGYNIQSFEVKRMINRDVTARTGKEILITNY